MKKYFASVLLALALLACSNAIAAPSSTDAQPSKIDFDRQWETALELDASQHFYLQYWAGKYMGATISDPDDQNRYVRYGLNIENKTDTAKENLQVTAYWNDKMQALGLGPDYDAQAGDRLHANCAASNLSRMQFLWSFPVDLTALAADDSVTLDNFHQLLVCIRWDGGSEWVRMDQYSMSTGSNVDTTPLLQEDLDSMVERGLQLQNKK